jgi:hypothetical protein
MEVNPDELVRLAAQSESAARVLATRWVEAQASLAVAHESLGDSPAAAAVGDAYATATTAADDVVRSLAQVLLTGVQALQQAAEDARAADERASERFLGVRRAGADDGTGPERDRDGRGDVRVDDDRRDHVDGHVDGRGGGR